MKKLFLITICIVLLHQLLCSMNHHCVYSLPSNSENLDSLPDDSLFQLDDSLLRIVHPQVLNKYRCAFIKVPKNTFSHVQRLHYTPNDSVTPNYLIITTDSLYSILSDEIRTYAEDVHAIYGYGIYLETTVNPTAEQLKSLIISYQENLCGVFFIGNLREAFYEVENDYNRYGYKNWPCDLYFSDLDGIWTDNDGNGIYDSHTGNVAPEIFFGRLSAAGLYSYGDDTVLIRRQLEKSHCFWWKKSFFTSDSVLNYIDKDWVNTFYSSDISPVFSSGIVIDIKYGNNTDFSPSDYLNRIGQTKYGFTHLAAHSSPTFHQFTNGNIYNSDIRQINSFNYAYNLFCCSACDWTYNSAQGYLGGAYLFNEGKTIAIVGSTKIGGMLGVSHFYSQFPTKNIGEALLYWWNHYYGNYHSENRKSWSYGMTIIGDPTINFRHNVNSICVNNLSLSSFPESNHSNLVLFKAGECITVSGNFIIPNGVHVIFDAPTVILSPDFECPLGASFETRNEGCEL